MTLWFLMGLAVAVGFAQGTVIGWSVLVLGLGATLWADAALGSAMLVVRAAPPQENLPGQKGGRS